MHVESGRDGSLPRPGPARGAAAKRPGAPLGGRGLHTLKHTEIHWTDCEGIRRVTHASVPTTQWPARTCAHGATYPAWGDKALHADQVLLQLHQLL